MSSLQSSHQVHSESDNESSSSYPVWAMSDDASEHHLIRHRREDTRPPQRLVESELTKSADSRNSRRSSKLPHQPPSTSTSLQSTISALYNIRNINSNCEDVPSVVNSSAPYLSSPVTRTDALAHYLGPSVSSSPSTPLQHVLNPRRHRPRTSNQVFTAPHSKIAPHGIPKSLPPAPSTAPRRIHPAEQTFPDFDALSQNYLNMLKQKSTDNTMEADSTATVEPAIENSAFGPEHLEMIMNVVTASSSSSMPPPPTPQTPELSSPAFSDINDFFSPDAHFLDTPVIDDVSNDSMLTGMFGDTAFEGGALFAGMDYSSVAVKDPELGASEIFDNLITMTPESPLLHDFNTTVNPSTLHPSPQPPTEQRSFLPSNTIPDLTPLPVSPVVQDSIPIPRRKSTATGTRKGVTPGALVSVDAPTQPRNYVLPSVTSRKELPKAFAQKRSRSSAFGEDDEEFNEAPPGPDASEREQIEYKRRQNTVAARRSRKRKLEYQQNLEASVERLKRECDVWKTRALMYHNMLQSRGFSLPPFTDTIGED